MQLKYNNYTHHNSQSTNKYQLSTEARKSSTTQPHRHDVLPYINLLDKCTQILREDRIWIRNQLKANDSQIIAIFKEARKPVNLQHLQIRLRKHVTAFKSKAKMEQLMKFKENMHLGDYKQEKVIQTKKSTSNPHKYQLLQSSNLSRTNASKMNNSQNRSALQQSHTSFDKTQNMESHFGKADKKPMIYPYRNTHNFQKETYEGKDKKYSNNLINSMTHIQKNMNNDYPAPMEQITERDSENMTSARHRIHEETLFNNKNSNEGMNFGAPFSYNQWKRPDAPSTENRKGQNIKDPLEQIRAQFSKVGIKNSQTSKIAEQMETFKNNFILDQESYSNQKNTFKGIKQHSNFNRFSLQQRDEAKESSRQNSAREQESYDQPEFSSYHQPEDKKQYLGAYHKFDSHLNSAQRNYGNHNNSLHSYQSNNSSEKNVSYNQKQQTQETNLMQNAPLTYTIPSSSAKNNSKSGQNENLFTSPELLAECRNFLKSKSSGKHTQNALGKFDMQGSLKPLNLKFDDKYERTQTPFSFTQTIEKSIANSQKTYNNDCSNFNSNTNINQNSKIDMIFEPQKQTKAQIEKQQSIENQELNDYNRDNYEYFHTFAAQSSQKKPQNANIQISIKPQNKINLNFQSSKVEEKYEKRNMMDLRQPKYENFEESYQNIENNTNVREVFQGESTTGELFTAEYFITFVLDLVTNEPKGYVYWRNLEKAIMEQCPQLMDAARDYLYNEEGLVLISNIGRVLDDLLESNPVQNDVKNIYRLLDIEQKGFIYGKDIEDFIGQLQESQAEDVETIAHLLWRLFEQIDEGIEEGQQKRIDYWGLYASHTNESFESLNQILKQFDFQIE